MKSKYAIESSIDRKTQTSLCKYIYGEAKTQARITRIIKENHSEQELIEIYKEIVYLIDIFEVDKDLNPIYYRKELALHKFYELRPEFKKKYLPKMSIETINKELGSMQNARESFGMEYHGRASKYYVRYGRKNVISGSYGSDIGTIVTFVTGLIFIIMIIMQYVKESNCESVTYYEYGVKKTGQVCDDSAKYQLRNNIDETKK
ncbi:hypothetical protein N8800_03605 [Gammaproteobacteria bacterium]|nr:hypothetical protein [Gammaproteobacteria bacterium]